MMDGRSVISSGRECATFGTSTPTDWEEKKEKSNELIGRQCGWGNCSKKVKKYAKFLYSVHKAEKLYIKK